MNLRFWFTKSHYTAILIGSMFSYYWIYSSLKSIWLQSNASFYMTWKLYALILKLKLVLSRKLVRDCLLSAIWNWMYLILLEIYFSLAISIKMSIEIPMMKIAPSTVNKPEKTERNSCLPSKKRPCECWPVESHLNRRLIKLQHELSSSSCSNFQHDDFFCFFLLRNYVIVEF